MIKVHHIHRFTCLLCGIWHQYKAVILVPDLQKKSYDELTQNLRSR